MANSQLTLYNDALIHCGERALANLSEERKPRRLLDQVWASGGVKACLEEADWNFAMRTIQIDYDPTVEPSFGYNRAFIKPSDWVRSAAICQDEFFNNPLIQYEDETGYWYSDLDTIYVRYVSNDTNYGADITSWPQSFYDFAAAHFASKVVLGVTGSKEKLKEVMAIRKDALKGAKAKSALTGPPRFPAQGGWSKARQGRDRGDRGNNSGNLVG